MRVLDADGREATIRDDGGHRMRGGGLAAV
jgi:hypothetical protein